MKKHVLKEFLRIFNYIKPNRLSYFALLLSDCLIDTSLSLLVPVVMKLMIDAAVKSNIRLLKSGVILTITVSVTGMIMLIILEFFLYRRVCLTTAKIRTRLFRHILHLPVAYVEKNHSGDTISRLTNDIENMQNAYNMPFRMILMTVIRGVSSSLLMFLFDWKVSILLTIAGILSVFINSKQKAILKKINKDIQKNMSKYTENLSNIIGGFVTIKSLRLEESMQKKAADINRDIYNNSIKLSQKSAAVKTRNFLFSSINFMGVVILAAFLAAKGINSLGSIVSMVFLLGNANRMFGEISNMLMKMQGYIAGSERVDELMETPLEAEKMEVDPVADSKAVIDMKNIVFSYDDTNNVLNGVSLKVEKGQVAALVGPSGGGKSTIVKLLLGYYQPSQGKMTINGKSVKNMTMTELRSLISYVPQDSYVFDGTIEENIKYGRYNATKDEIVAAARAANADGFIQELSNGYDSLVGERGIKLSGGQRQRLAIARAFLKDAPILLLDEATSSLDSQSERHVQLALEKLMTGKTVLVIAHRLSTIEHADLIYIIDSGRIAEYGTHKDLLANENLYRKLYDLQFKKADTADIFSVAN